MKHLFLLLTLLSGAASLNMVPYAFIENDRMATIPTVDKAFPMAC